jgi:hypothetical protein
MMLRCFVVLMLLVLPSLASAQSQAPAPVAAAPAGDQVLKPEELDALLAPIALYPDNLVSLVLMASTYPLEVVQADRWVKENQKLKGDALKAAVDKQAWDETVKALVAAPDVLAMMSSKLDWTLKLGDAVLAQQPDVMDAVQRLRSRADANNKLTSTKQQKVTKTQGEGGKQVIVIEQTNPQTLYVPYYDPAVVYGSWPYPAYPPYYWGYPGYIGAGVIATGLAFGAGWALGRWGAGGGYWGGSVNWNNNNINIDRGGNNWQHRPEHRQGVRYNNANVNQKFGNNTRAGAQNRMDYRGRGGDQRPGAGQRPAGGGPQAGQRPSGGGSKAGQKPSGGGSKAGQKPSGGGSKAAQRPSGGGSKSGQRPSGGGSKSAQRPSGGGSKGAQRPSAGPRPSHGGGGNAFGNVGPGRAAGMHSGRGHASLGGGGGGGFRGGGGGGGFRGGGGGGRGGGGRRSDTALKHDIVLLGHLANGIGYYRFSYIGSDRAYVGVMAQEVQTVMPSAVFRGQDGYLRVQYRKLGVPFQTYEQWIASGSQVPAGVHNSH